MVEVVEEYEHQVKVKRGRPNNLCIEDQILMLLEYYRENRTFFHLGTSYGICESNAQRNIVKIENILLQSGCFRLLGKKALFK
jgi:Helix-turn-helix of DDE superfamily endonuclease